LEKARDDGSADHRPRGNPQARNLFDVIGYLQQQAGVELHVLAGPR
jgi:hypothetical protein